MHTSSHKHVATEEVHATPFHVGAKLKNSSSLIFLSLVILEDFPLFGYMKNRQLCLLHKVLSILEVNSNSSCVPPPSFNFLFHAAACDTFPLVFDAPPDSATAQPGKGFYDTEHQLLWVCQPLGELYTLSSRLRKASCIQ